VVDTPTHSPITQAFVARLRASSSIRTALKGGIHEGYAPEKAKYPFLVWNLVAGPYDYGWGDVTLLAQVDAFVFSRNKVEADNLDQAVTAWVSDKAFSVTGQRTLICRRMATVPMPPDDDAEGMKVYQVGGTYLIETDVRLE
jgi:hypothetical protein